MGCIPHVGDTNTILRHATRWLKNVGVKGPRARIGSTRPGSAPEHLVAHLLLELPAPEEDRR
jgi:hypothetical protein